MGGIVFVNWKDIDGPIEALKKLEAGETTYLSKMFEKQYGEHESLLFIGTGIGLKKIKEEADRNQYVCIREAI